MLPGDRSAGMPPGPASSLLPLPSLREELRKVKDTHLSVTRASGFLKI